MTRQEAIARLCKLQAEVSAAVTGFDDAADCFCGESGFWRTEGYEYRNDGQAVEWIERVVRAAIAERQAGGEEVESGD